MNYGRKAAFSLVLTAVFLFFLGLLASKAMYGQPAHYEAPWWKFVAAIGFTIGFGANGLSRFGEWYHWKEVRRCRR